ncbi:unnamed protein product [Calypogeia fissa]
MILQSAQSANVSRKKERVFDLLLKVINASIDTDLAVSPFLPGPDNRHEEIVCLRYHQPTVYVVTGLDEITRHCVVAWVREADLAKDFEDRQQPLKAMAE